MQLALEVVGDGLIQLLPVFLLRLRQQHLGGLRGGRLDLGGGGAGDFAGEHRGVAFHLLDDQRHVVSTVGVGQFLLERRAHRHVLEATVILGEVRAEYLVQQVARFFLDRERSRRLALGELFAQPIGAQLRVVGN